MSKAEITNRLRENYIANVKEHIQELQKQGYVLANDSVLNNIYLMRFNLGNFKFEVVAGLKEAPQHIKLENVKNPFKVVLDTADFINIITGAFVMVDSDDLYAFTEYEENIEDVVPANDLNADLKSYLKLSKGLAGVFDKTVQDTPQVQAQILASKNVFYTGRDNILKITETNKYFQWDKKADRFKLLSAKDILNIIVNEIDDAEPRLLEIETNMRSVYPVMVTNTSFPVLWNRQKDLQARLKRLKKGHDKIQNIVENFV